MRPKKGDVIILRIDHYGNVYEGVVSADYSEGKPLRDEYSMVYCTPDFVFGTRELKRVDLTLKQMANVYFSVDTYSKKIEQRIEKLGYYWLAHARLVKNGKNISKERLLLDD